MPNLSCAELIIYADRNTPIAQGRYDESLAFHATKIAEILAQYYAWTSDRKRVRAQIIFDGAFIAFSITDVTIVRDTERPGL